MEINIEKMRKEIEKSVFAPKNFSIYSLKISDEKYLTAYNKMCYTCQVVIKYTEKRKICGKNFFILIYDFDGYSAHYSGIESIL